MTKLKKIVLSGAPGSGKTSVIIELEKRGYRVAHEVIRENTAKLLEQRSGSYENPLEALDDPIPFNRGLLESRLALYKDGHNFQFFDRGTVDVIGYMDYFGQGVPSEFEILCRQHPYDQLFYFEAWEAIYLPDPTRLETFKTAVAIDKILKKTYTYFGYRPILVPNLSVEERADFIITHSLR